MLFRANLASKLQKKPQLTKLIALRLKIMSYEFGVKLAI